MKKKKLQNSVTFNYTSGHPSSLSLVVKDGSNVYATEIERRTSQNTRRLPTTSCSFPYYRRSYIGATQLFLRLSRRTRTNSCKSECFGGREEWRV